MGWTRNSVGRRWAFVAIVVGTCVVDRSAGACGVVAKAVLPLDPSIDIPTVRAIIDGVPIRLTVDTGAPFSALNPSAERKLRLRPATMPPGVFKGIGGEDLGITAEAAGRMRLGAVTIDRPRFLIVRSTIGSADSEGSLGDDVLSRFDVELDMTHRRLTLFNGSLCGGDPPHWDGPIWTSSFHGNAMGNGQIFVPVTLNGVETEGVVDTGATPVIVSRAAALRSGVTQAQIDRGEAIEVSGFGSANVRARAYDFDNVVIAGVVIPKLVTLVQDLPGALGEVVIGDRLLRPFRVWISWREHRMLLTEAFANGRRSVSPNRGH